MKTILKKRENFIAAMIFLLTVVIAVLPLISRYCINGHDLEYHLLRIEALKENILMGRPFIKVDPLYFGGAGYASSLFYSNFLLYIPALLRVCGVSINASYHIFIVVCVVLTFLSAFYCTYKMTESVYTGAVAGMLITLSPYYLFDVMVRSAVGEYMAFIFVPFVIYGIYNTIYEQMNKPWILGIGFGGVLLSHTATFVMCIIFCAAAFIVKIKAIVSDTKILLKLIVTAVLTALATSFLWMPMMEQFISGSFAVMGAKGDMLDAAVDFYQILSNKVPSVGFALVLIAVLRVFIVKEDDKVIEYADWMLIGAAIFMIMATNILPWNILARLFSFVQFPWRFFGIASVLLSIADAIIIKAFITRINLSLKIEKENSIVWDVMIALAFVLMATISINSYSDNTFGYYDYSNDYYSYKPYTANVIGGEWLPASVENRDLLIEQSEHMTDNLGNEISFARNRGKVIALIDNGCEYVDVPLIYYKGYKAIITDANGKKTDIIVTGDGENGLSRAYVNGNSGELIVNYAGTGIQYASFILSFVAIAIIILYFASAKRKGKS